MYVDIIDTDKINGQESDDPVISFYIRSSIDFVMCYTSAHPCVAIV